MVWKIRTSGGGNSVGSAAALLSTCGQPKHRTSSQYAYVQTLCVSHSFAFFIFKHLQASSNSSTLGVHTSADASAGASTDACAGAPVASEGSAGSAGWAGGAASEAPEAPGTSVGELGELFWELFSWDIPWISPIFGQIQLESVVLICSWTTAMLRRKPVLSGSWLHVWFFDKRNQEKLVSCLSFAWSLMPEF